MPDNALTAKKYSGRMGEDFQALASKFCGQRTKICRQEKYFSRQQTGALQAWESFVNWEPWTIAGSVLDFPACKLKSRAYEIDFAGSRI